MERKEKAEALSASYQKLLLNAEQLSDILDEDMPELTWEDPKKSDDVDDEENDIDEAVESSALGALWEDEETKSFYEDLVDLKAFIPAILYKESSSAGNVLPEEKADEGRFIGLSIFRGIYFLRIKIFCVFFFSLIFGRLLFCRIYYLGTKYVIRVILYFQIFKAWMRLKVSLRKKVAPTKRRKWPLPTWKTSPRKVVRTKTLPPKCSWTRSCLSCQTASAGK